MADNKGRAVIGPTEFAVLVKIYNSILREPWFTTDEAQQDRFRRYIIKAFRAGLTEIDHLTAHCRDVARRHFAATTPEVSDFD